MNAFGICLDHGIALASGSQSTVKFSCSLCAPPALGDSTESVLREIGLSDEEIKTLLNDGVIAKPYSEN